MSLILDPLHPPPKEDPIARARRILAEIPAAEIEAAGSEEIPDEVVARIRGRFGAEPIARKH